MDPVWIKFISWIIWLCFFFGHALLFFILLPFAPKFAPSTFLNFKVFIPVGLFGIISLYFFWVFPRSKNLRLWAYNVQEKGASLEEGFSFVLKKCLLSEFIGLLFVTAMSITSSILFLRSQLSIEELFFTFVASFGLIFLGWPENKRAEKIVQSIWQAKPITSFSQTRAPRVYP